MSANIEIESLEEGEFTINGFIDSEEHFEENAQIKTGNQIVSAFLLKLKIPNCGGRTD